MANKKNNAQSTPLAIVGIGCLFPKANNPKQYWNNIRNGVDAITDIPDSHWNPKDYFNNDKTAPDMTYAQRGGFIDAVDFDPLLYGLSPNNIEATDTTQLLGMVVARQALLDAGYSTSKDNEDGRPFDRNRTSVILGVTGTLELVIPLGARLGHPHWRGALADAGVADDVAEDVVQRISDSYVPWQENSFPGLLGNVAAGRIANRFDLGGTNCVVDAACASSLSAIHMAALELYAGRSDMAISGGFDTFNDIFMYMCFSKTPALSPTGNSRPFDVNGDGTILGEGLGAVILKRLDDAKRDNDKIYAILKGMGSSSDGRGNAIYAPSATGQMRALKNAYSDAGVSPRTIELVEAHGTGTRVGDAVETESLSSVYREDRQEGTWCAVGSVKSMIGHTKAAAGVAGLIKIALALQHKVLPPTIKIDKPLENLNPGTAPVYVNTYGRPWLSRSNHPRRAALSAFGFGGSNFHCVLEEADSLNNEINWDGNILIYSLSAKSKSALINKLQAIDTAQNWELLRFQALNNNKQFNKTDNCRIVLVVSRDTDIKELIHEVCSKLDENKIKSWNILNSAYYGEGKPKGKLAMLFPGQGSQYTDMQLDLACQFPQIQNSLTTASQIFESVYPENNLGNYIYPIPVFTKEEKQKNTDALRQTQHAQPAIGAASIGLYNLLKYFGITPDITAGHSFGELTALCAAGVIDEASLIKLSIKRGELMTADDTTDRGSMLAVSASAAVVHEILEAEQLDLIIANNNAPRQVVLSGATAQIDRAIEVLGKRGLGSKKLPVSTAFHSSFIADAEKPFAKFLESIEFSTPAVPVYSNTTSEQYPKEPEKSRALLASQLARPVEFVSEIENIYEAGVRTFIETGPGSVITGLVNSILGDKPFNAVALDMSRGQKPGQYDLACVLAQIACLGHDVDLGVWDADFLNEYELNDSKKPSMSIKLSGANYMKPRDKRPAVEQREKIPAEKTVLKDASSKRQTETASTHGPKITNHNIKNQELLRTTQQTILSLQKMQQQTAELHRQYLEGQETAQKAMQGLLEQQLQLQSGIPVENVTVDKIPDTDAPAGEMAPPSPVIEPVLHKVEITDNQPIAAFDQDTELESLLLEVVSDKTGYPIDMLSLEMSLDTDLGIDSIKRVEILSALHERLPGAGSIQPEDLGTFRLLKHIAEFIVANNGQAQNNDIITASVPEQTGKETLDIQGILFQVVSDKTGYPVDMLNAQMNLDTDLGIDSIKRVEILSAFQEQVPEAPAINPDDLTTLQTLQQIIDYIAVSNISVKQPASPGVTESPKPISGLPNLTGTLLDIVADKTGYPTDMLNLEMNLDNDLGIDSIKRVEILSAFQEQAPEAPVMNPDDLATLQTLQQIVDYMQTGTANEGIKIKRSSDITTPLTVQGQVDFTSELLEVVADKTGYPVDMLDPGMNLDSDLGIDSIKRVEILSAFQEKVPAAPALNPDDLTNLQTLQQIIDFMHMGNSTVTKQQPHEQQPVESIINQELWRGTLSMAPVESTRQYINIDKQRLILVTDDGSDLPDTICQSLESQGYHARTVSLNDRVDENISGLLIVIPENIDADNIARTLELIQHHTNDLKGTTTDHQTLLASISRMGGSFGINTQTSYNPESAAIGGLIKTADKEWSGVYCRLLDIETTHSDVNELVGIIIDELLATGPMEIGIQNNQAQSIKLQTKPVSLEQKSIKALPQSGETIVISGGARGITAEIAFELASAYGTNLLLLGRSPIPESEPDWLSGMDNAVDIKQAIIHNSDQPMTPKDVEAKTRETLAAREVRDNLNRIRSLGVIVSYQPVDIRDTNQVTRIIDAAGKEIGPVTGIVHGAGILADKLIEDKTAEQFHDVYSTKVSGFKSLLQATRGNELKVLVTFSSTTARFGRKGQSDYAAANEVLNKMARIESQIRKNCNVISLNWGPWDGGMVTPQLRKLFESEGIGVIPLRAGAKQMVDELKSDSDVEIIILGSEPPEQDREVKIKTVQATSSQGKLLIAYERTVSIEELPILKSHIMNGKAVLPAALIIEWFAHGALHNNPGLMFCGLEEFRIFKGVIVDRDNAINVQIMASDLIEKNGRLSVPIELRQGSILHAGATIVLGNHYPQLSGPEIQANSGKYSQTLDEIYNNGLLFHGSALQGITKINGYSSSGISGMAVPAPQPSSWMAQPIRKNWIADPLLIDSAFQLMILWSFENSGSGSLPTGLKGYRQFRRAFPETESEIRIKILSQNKHSIRAAIEFIDAKGKLIAVIDDYECVVDSTLNSAFKNNSLIDETHS